MDLEIHTRIELFFIQTRIKIFQTRIDVVHTRLDQFVGTRMNSKTYDTRMSS